MPKKKGFYSTTLAVPKVSDKNPYGGPEVGNRSLAVPQTPGSAHGLVIAKEPVPPAKPRGTVHWNQVTREHHHPAGKPQSVPKASRSLNNIHKYK
jgi:hypothetical protein